VGDLLTVVVDEETVAREKVSTVATGDRSQQAGLSASLNPYYDFGAAKGVTTGMATSSRDVGEANRRGNLTAVITVRITAVEPNGVARIEGGKQVRVDGRLQTVRVSGLVRQEDVMPQHLVLSSRIADAEISYQGKKIGPRTGIIGKILSILWP
jgi:flagellar L-ring protein precursor FlgH